MMMTATSAYRALTCASLSAWHVITLSFPEPFHEIDAIILILLLRRRSIEVNIWNIKKKIHFTNII